jgi:hypothetical protein
MKIFEKRKEPQNKLTTVQLIFGRVFHHFCFVFYHFCHDVSLLALAFTPISAGPDHVINGAAACHKATPNIGPREYWPTNLNTKNGHKIRPQGQRSDTWQWP